MLSKYLLVYLFLKDATEGFITQKTLSGHTGTSLLYPYIISLNANRFFVEATGKRGIAMGECAAIPTTEHNGQNNISRMFAALNRISTDFLCDYDCTQAIHNQKRASSKELRGSPYELANGCGL